MANSTEVNCVLTFKKRNFKNQNTRKRQVPVPVPASQSNDDESSEDDTVVVKKENEPKINLMIQKTFNQKRKHEVHSVIEGSNKQSISITYKSLKTTQRDGPSDMGATAVLETETETSKDAQYYKKRDTAQRNGSSGMVRKKSIRASENLRATVRWDYQPDICKDYKETGFCGFGDSCKFMHDRTDYKRGWQLEKEVQDDSCRYEISFDEDELPFKCFICRKSFADPVITKCKHYFCEKCALSNYKKSKRCYVCAQQTNEVFKPAKEIIARLRVAADM